MFISSETRFVRKMVDTFLGSTGPLSAGHTFRDAAGKSAALNAQQCAGIKKAVEWLKDIKAGRQVRPFFHIDGLPGTGKTTLADAFIAAAKNDCGIRSVLGIAVAAKAAAVLNSKARLDDCMTLCRAVYTFCRDEKTGAGRFVRQLDAPASKFDLILLDEGSQVSESQKRDLLSFGVPIVVLSDVYGQLKPIVGHCGFVEATPDVFLTEICRQAKDSGIVRLSAMLRENRLPSVGCYGPGVVVLPLTKETQILAYREDTTPICGINRVRWAYTQRIRRLRGLTGKTPLPGEKILWRRNIRRLNLCNGTTGEAREVSALGTDGTLLLSVYFPDLAETLSVPTHPFFFEQHFGGGAEMPQLGRGVGVADWGNILTCHAAQGSEYEDVTVIDDSHAFPDQKTQWLNTALTRSSRNMTLLLRQ